MTADPHTFTTMISPAADVAIALARLLKGELDRGPAYYVEAGGLGFGYTAHDDGGLAIVVDWHGARCLQVVAPPTNDAPRIVQPFDEGGPWIAEMRDTLRDLISVTRPASDHVH